MQKFTKHKRKSANELLQYPYMFYKEWKGSPNRTYGDDFKELAESCDCVPLFNGTYTNCQYRGEWFICKSRSEYNALAQALSQSELCYQVSIGKLHPMEWDLVAGVIPAIWVDSSYGGYSVKLPPSYYGNHVTSSTNTYRGRYLRISRRNITAASDRTADVLNSLQAEIAEEVASTLSYLGYSGEILDYCDVDISKVDHTYARIEVRAELGYKALEKLMEALTDYISKIDQDAYFDAVDVGITECYVNYRKAAAAQGVRLHSRR